MSDLPGAPAAPAAVEVTIRDSLTVDGALLQAKLEVAHASGYAEGLEAALAVCVAREDLRAAKTRLRELIKRARARSPKE